MWIFYLLYYLFFIVSLLAIPYVTSYYILAGDPYLIVSSGYYYYFWLIISIFIIAQAFSLTSSAYQCFFQNNNDQITSSSYTDSFTRTLTNLHNLTLASFYTSIYITILGFGGYLGGVTAMDTIPAVKELLVGVIHIPGFEFILKGIPLALGAIIGNIIAFFCVTSACY